MAAVGEVITNPGTGEQIEFLQTRATTNGEFLQFELTLEPFGRVGGLPHQHPATETLEVLEGRLSCRFVGGRRELGPGDSVVVPPNADHFFFNDAPERVRARVTARPPHDFETFFETVFAIGERRQYRAWRGLPPPLHAALLSHTYDVYAPLVPIALQRPLLAVLARLGRKRGYAARPAGAG